MGATIRCGAAWTDITPIRYVPGIPLAGFESNRKAQAVLDPLEAGALYLTDGSTDVVLVTLDLIGFYHPYVEEVRSRLAGRLPRPENVLIASTHTHAGPDTMGLWGPSLFDVPIRSGVNPDYLSELLDRIVSVVEEAVRDPVPVTVRAARYDVPADWTRNDRKGGGKDDQGWALAFDDAEGRRVATLIDFACHPETLWEGNPLVSPDYPAALRRRVRERAGGVPLFFSGALGGMVTPDVDRSLKLEQRKVEKDRLGTDLADVASSALDDAKPLEDTALRITKLPLELPLGNRLFRLLRLLGIVRRSFAGGFVRTEMNLVRLGPEVSLMTAPGECTPEVGRELSARMPGSIRLLLCLGCDELGYILTPEQYANPEYHYEKTMSVGPRTAPLLWEAAERLARS